MIAGILVRRYKAPTKAAIIAALPRNANTSDIARVQRAHQKLVKKQGELPSMISVQQTDIDAAAARLAKATRNK